MNSLGLAENISEWNWTYDSTDTLISCVWLCLCLSKTRASIGSFWPFLNWFHQSGTKPNFFCSQNFCYHLWCLFCNVCRCFQKYVQWGSYNNVIKYWGWGIPHNWDISFGKFGGLPTLVAFPENLFARQEHINCFKYERQRVHWNAPHHWMPNFTRHSVLTHWGRDKIDAILQTAFLNAISWMKMFEFRLKFHWSLFLKVQLTIFQHCFR